MAIGVVDECEHEQCAIVPHSVARLYASSQLPIVYASTRLV